MPLRPSPSLGHLALATLVVVGTSASVPDVNAARRAELDRNPVAAMPVWVSVPATRGLVPAQLAVVINSADTQSVIVGKAYVAARHVPAANVVTLNFSTGAILSSVEFAKVKAELDAALSGTQVQALALAWTWPYRVECMSVTSAFALGFNATLFCKNPKEPGPCSATAPTPYFNSTSSKPFTDFKMRPAMLLAGWSADAVARTVAAGVASDGSHPKGTAYMVLTHDHVRSCRQFEFIETLAEMQGRLGTSLVNCSSSGPQCPSWPHDYLENATDVLTYFTGLTTVPGLATNKWLPGAMGDHLTSYGGILTNTSGQMPCIEFLAAGATGSYGTVVEPCAFTAKFPDPSVLLPHYLAGDTLIEAYWKSVNWPGEGLFVGEPLACPYRPAAFEPATVDISETGPGRVVITAQLAAGEYDVYACSGDQGSEECSTHTLASVSVRSQPQGTQPSRTRIELPLGDANGFVVRHRAAPLHHRSDARCDSSVRPLS